MLRDSDEDGATSSKMGSGGTEQTSNTIKTVSPGHANFINIMSAKERENDIWKKKLNIADFKTIRTTFRLDPDIKLHEKDWELLYNQHCHQNSYHNYYPEAAASANERRFEDDLKDIDKYRKLIDNEKKYQFYDEKQFSTTYHIDQVLSWVSDEDIRTLTRLWFHQAIQGSAIFFPSNRTELALYQIRQSLPYRFFIDACVVYLLLSPTIMPHQCLTEENNAENTVIVASLFIIFCCLIQFMDIYIGYRTTHWTRMTESDVNNSLILNRLFPYSPSNHIQFDHNLNWQRVRCITAFVIILNSIAHMARRDIPNLCRIIIPLLLIAKREDLKQLLHGMYYASKKVTRLLRLAVIFVFVWAFLGFCFLRRYSVGTVSDEVRFSTYSQALYACVHCMLSRPTVLYRLKPIFVENNYSSFYFVVLTLLGDIMLTTIIISMGTRAFRKFSLQNMEGRLKYRHVAIHSLFRLYTKRYPGDAKYNRLTMISSKKRSINSNASGTVDPHHLLDAQDKKEMHSSHPNLDSIKDTIYIDYAMNRHCWITFVENLDEKFQVSSIKNSILLFYLEACRKENSNMAGKDVTESDVGGLIFEKSFFRLCGLLSCRLKFFTDALFMFNDKRSSMGVNMSAPQPDIPKPHMSEEFHPSNNTISYCCIYFSKVLHNWYKAIRYHPKVMAYQEVFQQRVFNMYHYVVIFYYPSWCDWFVERWLVPVVKFFFYQSKPQIKGEWRVRVFHFFQFTLYSLSIMQTCLLANAKVATGVVIFQWFILLFFVIENQILAHARMDVSLFEVRATAVINFASLIALSALSASISTSRSSSSYTSINDDALTAVLIIESVRYIKVIISSKPFQSVASIIPVIGRAVYLYVMILYSFALLGHITLCNRMNSGDISANADDDAPGWVPFSQFLNFNSIYSSYYTVAASAVLSNWSMIMDAAVSSTDIAFQSWVYAYFYFLRFFTVVIVIPLLLSCVIQAFIQFLDKRAADKQALIQHEKEQEKENLLRMSIRKSKSLITDDQISSIMHQINASSINADTNSASFAVSDVGEEQIRRSLSIAFARDVFGQSKRARTKAAILANDKDDDDDDKNAHTFEDIEPEEEWSDVRITNSLPPAENSISMHSVASSIAPTKPKRLLTRTSILGLDYYHLTSLLSHNNLDIDDPIAALWSPNGRASVQYNQVRSPLEARYADLSVVSTSRHHERLDKVLDRVESKLYLWEKVIHSKMNLLLENQRTQSKNNEGKNIDELSSKSAIKVERFEVHDSLVVEKLRSWMKDYKEFSTEESVEEADIEKLTKDKLRSELLKNVKDSMPKSEFPLLASHWFMESINGRPLYYPTTTSQLRHLLILRSNWFMILLGVVVVFQMFAIFLVVPRCTIRTVVDPSESTISHQALNIMDLCCCVIYTIEIYLDGFTNYCTYQYVLQSFSAFDSLGHLESKSSSYFRKMKQAISKFLSIISHGLVLRIFVVCLIILKSIYSIQNPGATLSNLRLIRGVFPYLVLSHYPHFSDILIGLRTSLYRSRMVYILFGSIVILFSIIGYFQFHRYATHAGRFEQLSTAFLTILQCSTSAPFSLYVVLPYFQLVSQLSPLFYLTLTYITEILCISLIVGAGNVYFAKYGNTALAMRRKLRYQSLMQIFRLLSSLEDGETVSIKVFIEFVKLLPEKYLIPESQILRLLAYMRRIIYSSDIVEASSQYRSEECSIFTNRMTRAEFFGMAGCIYRCITLYKVESGKTLDHLYKGMSNFDHGYYFGKESIISFGEIPSKESRPIKGFANPPFSNLDSDADPTDIAGGIELGPISSPMHNQSDQNCQKMNADDELDDIGITFEEEDERNNKRIQSKSPLNKMDEDESQSPSMMKESITSIHQMDNVSLSSLIATTGHEGKSLLSSEQEIVYIVVIKDDNRISYLAEVFPSNVLTRFSWLQTIVNSCHMLVYCTLHIYSKSPVTLTITLIDIYGFCINLLLVVQLVYYTSSKYCSKGWAIFGYFLESCIIIELLIRMIGTGDRHFLVYEVLHSARLYLAIFIVVCMIVLQDGYMDNSKNIHTSYLMVVVAQCFNLIFGFLQIRPHSHNSELLKKDSIVLPSTNIEIINSTENSKIQNGDLSNIQILQKQRRIDYSSTMQIYHNHYIRSGISNSVSNRRFKLSIENMFRSILLLIIILYFYAIIAQDSFCGILSPNDVVGSPTNDDDASSWNNFGNILNFNNYPQTMFTLFEVTVLGSWSMVMDAVLYNYPHHEFSVYAFFFIFRLSMTLIFVPLLMSFMVRSFIALHDQISFIHKRRKTFLKLAKRQREEDKDTLSRISESLPLDSPQSVVGVATEVSIMKATPVVTTNSHSISSWCQALWEGKLVHYYPPAIIKYQTVAPYLDIWDTTALHDSDIITVQDPVFTKTMLAVENAGWKLRQYFSFLSNVDLEKCFASEDDRLLLIELKGLLKETAVVLKECDELSSLL